MITTKQLCEWEQRIKTAHYFAETGIKKYGTIPTLRNYYVHLARTADAQLSIVQRLIRQSKEQEDEK